LFNWLDRSPQHSTGTSTRLFFGFLTRYGRRLRDLHTARPGEAGCALGSHSDKLPESNDQHAKEREMTFKTLTPIVVIPLVPVVALTLALVTGSTSVSAFPERTRALHVTKECLQWHGAAGEFCTITSSNLARIKVGTRIYYDQPAGIPAGLLDSNVVLDAGYGNRAVGRCTLDLSTGLGLCTFSDGTGRFAGFNARVQVTPPSPEQKDWRWEGTYSFDPID
jgi:hypothetical protein